MSGTHEDTIAALDAVRAVAGHEFPPGYVQLADQLDTVVVTTDQRLARATPLAVAPPE